VQAGALILLVEGNLEEKEEWTWVSNAQLTWLRRCWRCTVVCCSQI